MPPSTRQGLGKTVEIISLVAASRESEGRHERRLADGSLGGGTLIITPMSILGQWEEEVQRHVAPGALTCDVYYGGGRNRDNAARLTEFDVVLSTYGVIQSEASDGRSDSPLFQISWRRVVLDEAHYIKNRTTATAKAVFGLSAERRWAVTGTPLQNQLEDLVPPLPFISHPSRAVFSPPLHQPRALVRLGIF
jgi:DNA repair protein RAD5